MQLLGIFGLLFTDYRFKQGLQIKNIDNNLLFQTVYLERNCPYISIIPKYTKMNLEIYGHVHCTTIMEMFWFVLTYYIDLY